MFMLGGKTISWSSKKQPIVALSLTEAEYKVLSHATCEAVWMNKLLSDLQVQHDRFVLLCDNMSSIYLAKNPMFHARSKHIEVQYHFVREKVLSKEVDIMHINTEWQVANIFTKLMDTIKLRRFIYVMNLKEICSSA